MQSRDYISTTMSMIECDTQGISWRMGTDPNGVAQKDSDKIVRFVWFHIQYSEGRFIEMITG